MRKLLLISVILMAMVAGASAVSFVSSERTVGIGESAQFTVTLDTTIAEGVIYEIRCPSELTVEYATVPSSVNTTFEEIDHNHYRILLIEESDSPIGTELATLDISGPSEGNYVVYLENGEYSDNFLPYSITDGKLTLHVAIVGDLNGDNLVNHEDFKVVLDMLRGNVAEDLTADFNENGRIDIGDAVKLLWHIVRGTPL